jgi:putative hemolysin
MSLSRLSSTSQVQKHIVDTLIEERAPRLSKSIVWPLLGALLRAMLNYSKARALADAIKNLPGRDTLEYVSRLLGLTVEVIGIENVPAAGQCIIVCNHPTGVADGVAVYDALIQHRPDLCFFANADAHRVSPGLSDVLIPVAWPAQKRTAKSSKRTLRLALNAFEAGRPVTIFPAGALSRKIAGRIQDPDWEHSAVALAKKHKIPIVPIHIAGPFPHLFHFFDRISSELRDVTLFHELLNKEGKKYQLTIGPLIEPVHLAQKPDIVTECLKNYVEASLPSAPRGGFDKEDISDPDRCNRSAE